MPRTKKSHRQETSSLFALPILLVGAVLLTSPASADWLITQEQNKMIETRGPWSVEGDSLTYTDTEGNEKRVPLAQINLVASEKLTAMKSARPVVPPRAGAPGAEAPRAAVPRAAVPRAAVPRAEVPKTGTVTADASKAESDESKVILYMTSWCGYCRRTSQLLKTMQVAFVEKDIEQDPKAKEEYRQKANGYRGIPVLDIDGQIVKGFKATRIRDLVEDMKRKEAAAAESEPVSTQASGR